MDENVINIRALLSALLPKYDNVWEKLKEITVKKQIIMKELSIKEKAERYDEVIKKLRSLHDDYDTVSTLIDIKEELENIFPELKESDAERMLRSLREGFNILDKDDEWYSGITNGQILAWLEKQDKQILANSAKKCKDEQKPTDKEMKETLRTEYEKGRADVIAEMQNHAWSEEDEQHIDSLLKRLDGLCRNEFERTRFAINEDEDWLKSLKDRVGCEANCTTTKEQNIYKNGVYQETNGVRIWHNGHTFLVPKDWNKGKWPLLNKKGEENSKQNKEHLMSEIDALLDWDFVAATKHIQDLGTDIPLKDGEYLITAPVWLAMYEHRIALNKALSNIGAMEIDFNEDFWFAERYHVSTAWNFSGTTRNLYSGYVYDADQVGAVML